MLAERRAERARLASSAPATFYFDLSCPFSYLAAERIERILGEVEWVPVAGSVLRSESWIHQSAVRAHAETCAVALRLPLVWPDTLPIGMFGALRAAAFAVEIGAGARFALAASRLAFCGGFDLEDPEILAEAAAAAGVPLRACLAAAGDDSRDEQLLSTARALHSKGIDRLPVIRVGQRWLRGEGALAEASALLHSRRAVGGPLAPAS